MDGLIHRGSQLPESLGQVRPDCRSVVGCIWVAERTAKCLDCCGDVIAVAVEFEPCLQCQAKVMVICRPVFIIGWKHIGRCPKDPYGSVGVLAFLVRPETFQVRGTCPKQ
jgi:hypothetical protein